MRQTTQKADDLEAPVGRRLPPSCLEVFSTTILPRPQFLQASNRAGFPREAFWSDAGFEAARREPPPYQVSALHVPSCPSWMNTLSAPAEPSVYRIPISKGPKLRGSGPNRPLPRSLGNIGDAGRSINRTALRASGAEGPCWVSGTRLRASSRPSRTILLAGRGRPAYGTRHFSYKPLTHRSPAAGGIISQLP